MQIIPRKIWCVFVQYLEVNGSLIFLSLSDWNISLAVDNKKFQRSMGRIRKYRPSLNIVGESEIASRCDPLYLYTIFHLIVFNTPPPQKKEQTTAKPTFCRPLFRTITNVPLNSKRECNFCRQFLSKHLNISCGRIPPVKVKQNANIASDRYI